MVFLSPKFSSSTGRSGISIGYRRVGRQESIGAIVLALSISMIVPMALPCSDAGITFGAAAFAQSSEESTSQSTDDSTPSPTASPSGTSAASSEPLSNSEQFEVGTDEDEDIKSVGEVIQDGQLAHEKILVDRFLFGVSLIFLLIALLLFRSLPPKGKEAGES